MTKLSEIHKQNREAGKTVGFLKFELSFFKEYLDKYKYKMSTLGKTDLLNTINEKLTHVESVIESLAEVIQQEEAIILEALEKGDYKIIEYMQEEHAKRMVEIGSA